MNPKSLRRIVAIKLLQESNADLNCPKVNNPVFLEKLFKQVDMLCDMDVSSKRYLPLLSKIKEMIANQIGE